jgi:AraC family carnitine catabolism transcriptional activator
MKHDCRTRGDYCVLETRSVHFAFVLCSGFSLLDLATAISTLNASTRAVEKDLFFLTITSVDGQSVPCSNGVPYPVEGSCLDLDPKTRAFVFADLDYFKNIDPRLCAWLRKSAHSGLEMGSFGTDAGVLLKAGILLGRRFTIHWGAHAVFAERFPEVLPLQNLFEVDGRFYTSAGGLSSADMMIELLTSHMGQTFGVRITDHILGSTPRTIDTLQRQSTALRYGTRNPAFLAIIGEIDADESGELSIECLLERHPISRRQLERLFNQYCGISPTRYLKSVRLEWARKLLEQTNMSIIDVSVAVGFSSAANFSNSFLRKFGCRPKNYRG